VTSVARTLLSACRQRINGQRRHSATLLTGEGPPDKPPSSGDAWVQRQ